MSSYIFAPGPPIETTTSSYVTWDSGFTEEELDRIDKYCLDNLVPNPAIVGSDGVVDLTIRSSQTAWINLNEETAWFYDRMAWIARKLNSAFYGFDLTGFHEDFQYTIYKGEEKAHYDWHIDNSSLDNVPRKFSMVLQLSDPKDYEGGNLEIKVGSTPDVVDKKRGLVAAFPAYRLHRVSPVKKGIRKSIVIWVVGPAFR